MKYLIAGVMGVLVGIAVYFTILTPEQEVALYDRIENFQQTQDNNPVELDEQNSFAPDSDIETPNTVPFWYNWTEDEIYQMWRTECLHKNLEFDDVYIYLPAKGKYELRDPNTSEAIIEAIKICQRMEDRWRELYRKEKDASRENNAEEFLENYRNMDRQ